MTVHYEFHKEELGGLSPTVFCSSASPEESGIKSALLFFALYSSSASPEESRTASARLLSCQYSSSFASSSFSQPPAKSSANRRAAARSNSPGVNLIQYAVGES